mmetsp:Transcript_23863/g.80501  ORF Transcript_23863/g.80501 Transcript_23863/m.80501 type:complete len:97 (-) Transcript_23863:80-370(-)
MRLSSMPLEALRAHVGATRGTADAVGPDWSAVLRLVDVVGVNTLERAAVLLAPCVRDDWAHGDADASARECYVALTRPECGLALPRTLHARLTRST